MIKRLTKKKKKEKEENATPNTKACMQAKKKSDAIRPAIKQLLRSTKLFMQFLFSSCYLCIYLSCRDIILFFY